MKYWRHRQRFSEKMGSCSDTEASGLATQTTLVRRLQDWNDHEVWRKFFDRYWKLIYGVARRGGLTPSEAEDVVQETVITVAKKMGAFHYDRAVCTFKGWLLHVTRLRMIDQLRKRLPCELLPGDFAEADEAATGVAGDACTDPAFATLWEEEWRKNLVDAAMTAVKQEVNPLHYQVFHLTVVQKVPPGRVAALTGVSRAQVYLVRHRLGKIVLAKARAIEAEESRRELPSPQ